MVVKIAGHGQVLGVYGMDMGHGKLQLGRYSESWKVRCLPARSKASSWAANLPWHEIWSKTRPESDIWRADADLHLLMVRRSMYDGIIRSDSNALYLAVSGGLGRRSWLYSEEYKSIDQSYKLSLPSKFW